jgi:hypothetical protein
MKKTFLSRTVLHMTGPAADEIALNEICQGNAGTSDFETLGYAYRNQDALRFAAAKDMLSALESLYKWWTETSAFKEDEDDIPAEIFDGICDAIAKARGQQ